MKTKARKSRRNKVATLCHPRASGDLFNKDGLRRIDPPVKPGDDTGVDLFAQVSCCVDEKIRPFIQMDGGEIELVELTKKNVLKVRLLGACCGCPAAGITLSYGVQAAIDEEFPEEDIQVLLVE